MLFMLLAIITVSASSHPLESPDATTSLPDAASKAIFTVPLSDVPSKTNASVNRLEITLKMDEQSDKEVVDNDMGKYPSPAVVLTTLARLICRKVFPCVGDVSK